MARPGFWCVTCTSETLGAAVASNRHHYAFDGGAANRARADCGFTAALPSGQARNHLPERRAQLEAMAGTATGEPDVVAAWMPINGDAVPSGEFSY